MGSTKCYDTLIAIAKVKAKKFKSNVEPHEKDSELESKVQAEKAQYEAIAQKIYEAEKLTIESKFKLEKVKIDASEKILKAKFTEERFNSTDAKTYGESGIKTTFSKELQTLNEGIDKINEKALEEAEKTKEEAKEQSHKTAENLINKKTKDSEERHNKKKKNRKEKEEKESARGAMSQNDIISAASEIGKGTDKDIDDLSAIYEDSLKKYKEMIETDAKNFGDQEGAKLVQAYNTIIIDSAKKAFEKNKDTIAKAQVKVDQAKQTAILKLGAKLGL